MDLDNGLANFRNNQFDLAILHYTIQEVKNPLLVFKEMLRVANECIIVFSNFAHWQIRMRLLLTGQMPVNEVFPYQWYNTPNIHLMSLKDLEELCQREGAIVKHRIFFGEGLIDRLINLLSLHNLGSSTVLMHLMRGNSAKIID